MTESAKQHSEPPLLSARGVIKRFGRIQAVDGMHLEVMRGEIVGLIGPNGAGKTTFFNCLSGWYRPDAGEVRFKDRSLRRVAAYQVARRGLVRTFQISRTLARMSVRENLMLAPAGQLGERLWSPFLPVIGRPAIDTQEEEVRKKADRLLASFALDHLADDYAGTLSGGQRKLLELARALMLDPEMLLLDEPMAGVNPTLARGLMERIHAVRKDHGTTVLLIEHDMETVMNNCERVVVMAEGRLLAAGTPREIQQDPAVMDAYLGV